MRLLTVLGLSIAMATAYLVAAERDWKTGVWAFPADGRIYVIESPTQFITGEVTDADHVTIPVNVGGAVQYVTEARTLVVQNADNSEHTLRLVSAASKYAPSYDALGGGHYIKAVTPGGRRVTLEDGTRWDIDPRGHFSVSGWEADDLISVRRSNDDPAYTFEIDNTSRDDGALTNRLVR